MMFYDHIKDLQQEKSLETLKQLFGKDAPSRTAATVTNIAAVESLIRAEPRVTTRKIPESLSTGTAATMSIFHDHLQVRKR